MPDSAPILPRGFTRLSVLMPCYRLAPVVGKNIAAVCKVLGDLPFEIVPVDDGSGDGTDEALLRAQHELGVSRIHPVILPKNVGKGAALVAGFANCTGSHVLLLDGDLDLAPSMIWRFFEIMKSEEADVVIGSKLHPESKIEYPLRRRIASFIYYSLVKLLVGLPVHDTQTGMKLFTRRALGYAFDRMLSKRFAFDLELLSIDHIAGFRIAEAPVILDFGEKAGCLTPRNVREVMQDTLAIFYRVRILRYYQTLEIHSMPVPRPRVSAVIACPGHSKVLDECIEALKKQCADGLYEAIILPDESTGKTWPDFVREIPTGKVRPSRKRNIGIREAKGDVVAFIDDDAAPCEGWLAHALPYFGDKQIGAVGGPASTPPSDPYLAKLSGRVFANPLVAGGYRRRYVPTAVCDEDDLPSCNLLARTSLLREIGGFDEEHWPGEDTILCLDIVHHFHKRLVYDPWVEVHHHRRKLFAAHLRQVARYAERRGHFARRFPETSRRIGYVMPTLLVVGAVGTLLCWYVSLAFANGTALLAIFGMLATIGGCVLALYAALAILSSASLNPVTWLLTTLGVFATHFTYGLWFVSGVLSKEMDQEVKPFDHRE